MNMESHGGMILTGENGRIRIETCYSAILYTKNPIWTDPRANPGLRGKSLTTNRLSHGTATRIRLMQQSRQTPLEYQCTS
jgi:hypothetical protein